MISPPVIHNLNELIEPHLNGCKLISYTTRFLVKPSDNYGSTMLGIKASIQNSEDAVEELELVAKIPPMSEMCWNCFQPQKTFVIEKNIYTELAPALQQLQEDQIVNKDEIIDLFAKCYGARLSLENNSKVDRNATLILENLVASGYTTGERSEGFDYEHTVLILEYLAYYHALPIALRLLRPKVYKEKCLDIIQHFNINKYFDEDVKEEIYSSTIANIEKIPEVEQDIIKRIQELHDLSDEYLNNSNRSCDGIFDTVAHNDFWVNNMMILYNNKGEPCKLKIVDFQLVQVDSLVHDVIFFLFTSVKSDILSEKYEEFLGIYYNYFISFLNRMGCSTAEYSYAKFLKEIERIGPVQVIHIMFMLKVLFLDREVAPSDFSDIDMNIFNNEKAYGAKYFNKLRDILLMLKKIGLI